MNERARTYEGSCHCGKVKYEVTTSLEGAMSCNCSICGRSGTVLAFAPAATFKLLSGEDALTDYTFHKHSIHHLLCKTCGIKSFARGKAPDGQEMIAVNVRCLDGVDVDTMAIQKVDGRSF